MTKSELVTAIAHETKEKKELVDSILTAALAKIQTSDKTTIKGFGNFTRKVRPARSGVSALDGKAWASEEKTVLTFKAAK